MPRGRPVIRNLVIGLVVLLVVAGATTVRRVERSLVHDAEVRLEAALEVTAGPDGAARHEALARAGISRVAASGHEITVHGVPRSAAETARLLAAVRGAGITGVRHVVDDAATVSGASGGVELTVRSVGGTVELGGRVQSDAQCTTLVAAATFAFGARRVRSGIEVVPVGPRDAAVDEAVSHLATLLTGLARAATFDVVVRPTGVDLRAVVPDAATRDLLASLADSSAGNGAHAVDVRIDATTSALVGERRELTMGWWRVLVETLEEARTQHARIAALEESIVAVEADRRAILLERDALARQVRELEGELRQARRRAAREVVDDDEAEHHV